VPHARPFAFAILLLLLGGCPGEAAAPAPDPATTDAPEDDAPDTEDNEPPPEAPTRGESTSRTVYIPAYSQLATNRGRQTRFAVTLSVRNVDPTATITLAHVDYYDTSGHRVRRYLRQPRTLRPLETAEYSVETLDEAGGSGANFLVYWEGPSDAHPLLTETVMIGHIGNGYASFTSRGVELERPPILDEPEDEPAAP